MSAGVVALSGVSLTMHAGEVVAVTGPSGSGKTTLLNLLGLLDSPDDGEIELNGQSASGLKERTATRLRAQSIGFVFQEAHLVGAKSALENVALGLRYAGIPRRRRVAGAKVALESVGLADRILALPKELSSGERQRVAFARATAHNPPLLLCDEPTGNLDMENTRILSGHIDAAAGTGTCVVVATHDPTVADAATRIVSLMDGRVVQDVPTRVQQWKAAKPREAGISSPGLGERLMDLIEDVRGGLGRRVGSSFLTGVSTFLGVGVLVFAAALTSTTAAEVARDFDLLGATTVEVVATDSAPVSVVDDSAWAQLRALPGVVHAGLLQLLGDKTVSTASGLPTASRSHVVGVSGIGEDGVEALGLEIEGSSFSRFDHLAGTSIALVGQVLATSLEDPIASGSMILIGGRSLRVVGTINDAARHAELLLQVVVPVAAGTRLWPRSLSESRVVLQTEVGAPPIVAEEAIAILAKSSTNRPTALYAPEASNLRREVTGRVDALVLLVTVSLLATGAVAIAAATTSSVYHRRSEIGLRRAIGASRIQIAALFLAESSVIGTVAALVGLAVALGLFLVVSTANEWTPVIDSKVLALSPIAGLLVGLLGGAWPARQAASIDPARALRT
ncbi:MAG: ATP-binding cassette domain-containing protein [Actinobacteria bacterium]|nr:ATP-binding cassette domain-containing protein [Actinomycetota bacterium]